MSLSSQGSIRSRSSGPRRNSGTRFEMEHDIYAAYSDDDQQDVLPILDILKQKRLNVYDPHIDALPNQTLFKGWLEHGIHKSKITVVFLTKKFASHNYCRYQADNAAVRYTKTKGRHRLIIVMLQSCKIPKNLQHFNCVYAWKFREQPEEQYTRILKAIFAPRDKFRRGSVLWTNVSRNVAQLAKKRICELSAIHKSNRLEKSLLKYTDLLFNLSRIKFALENCELKCTSENCEFRCRGDKIIDQFFSHVKVCKYQQVKCRFCRQTILRKNHQKHEQTTCKRRHIPCPNESCRQMLAVSEMYGHARVCSYKEVACKNNIYGCTGVFARKDKAKHLEICEFEKVTCQKCDTLLFHVDIATHKCHKCEVPQFEYDTNDMPSIRENEIFKCYFAGCTFTGSKHDLEAHYMSCEFRIEQCADCGMRFPYRDLVWHRRQCDRVVECELCHQLVPSSSKLTHDRWICNGQNIQVLCEVCHNCISNGRKETHSMSCLCGHQDIQTGTTSVPFTGALSSSPVQINGRYSSSQDGSSARGSGYGLRMTTHANYMTRLSPTYERLLFDVMPLRTTRWRERSYSDDTDCSYTSSSNSHSWAPSSRDQWRALMHQIDTNTSGLRMAMSKDFGHFLYEFAYSKSEK